MDPLASNILPPQWIHVLSPPQMFGLAKRNSGLPLLKKFGGICKKYWLFVSICVGVIVAEAYLEQLPSDLYRRLFDEALPSQNINLVMNLAIKLLALLGLTSGMGVLQNYLSTKVSEGVGLELRESLYIHLSKMPFHFFTILKNGDFVSLFNNELVTATHAIGTTIPRAIHNVSAAVLGFRTLYNIEPAFALMMFFIIPIFQIPSRYFGEKLKEVRKQEINTRAELNNTLQDHLSVQGMLLSRTFGNQGYGIKKFSEANSSLNAMGLRRSLLSATFMQVLAFSVSICTGVIYTFGSSFILSRGLTIGKIMAFANSMHRVYGPLTELSNIQVDYRSVSVCFARLFSYLDLPTEKSANDGTLLKLTDVAGDIKFSGVSFQYPRSLYGDDMKLCKLRCVLHDVTFDIKAGQKVVIVGANGAGKTSVAQLLARLYVPNEGHVEVDGHDVQKISRDSYCRVVGFLSQDTFLLNDSLENNLLYAKPKATMEEMESACEMAGMKDLLDRLPQRLKTTIGERAFALSLGERQKLALARFILRDYKIIIMDEFSSNLDPSVETELHERFSEIFKHRTMLMISHRINTAKWADKVIVMADGRIVEQGTYQELVQKDEHFTKLFSGHIATSKSDSEIDGEIDKEKTKDDNPE